MAISDPVQFDERAVRRVLKKWPNITIHGGLTEAWRSPHVQRGDYLVQRHMTVTWHAEDTIKDDAEQGTDTDAEVKGTDSEEPPRDEITMTIESDEHGGTKVTAAFIKNPNGLRFRADGEDSSTLMLAALAHTMFVKVGESGWEGLTDASGRFSDPEAMLAALRSLNKTTKSRRSLTRAFLAEVAEFYNGRVEAGDPHPTMAVAREYGRPRQTAASWVMEARKAGLIAPAEKRN